jgi:transposase-like protein
MESTQNHTEGVISMTGIKIPLDASLVQSLLSSETEGVRKLLKQVLEAILEARATDIAGAERYERSEDRKCQRNGYREKWITFRIGRLKIRIPQLRGDSSIDRESLNMLPRIERALVLTVLEMSVNGVSTRKVRHITEELCGWGMSKSTVSRLCKDLDEIVQAWNNRSLSGEYPFLVVDALYVRVRCARQVIKKAVHIAIGVRGDGKREIIGVCVSPRESQETWKDFFNSLIDRGLKGVRFITSDQHQGLVNAADECFPESSWNRCQTHFSRNLLSHVPEQYHDDVLEDLHSIYNCKSHKSAMKKANEVILKYGSSSEESLRRVADKIDEAKDDILAVYVLPKKYHKKLRTSNMVERLNREIRRREKVIGIFPSDSSVMRLIGTYLMEIDEDWTTGRVYMDMKEYELWAKEQEDKKKTQQIKAVSKKTVEVT